MLRIGSVVKYKRIEYLLVNIKDEYGIVTGNVDKAKKTPHYYFVNNNFTRSICGQEHPMVKEKEIDFVSITNW